jgi:DNA-binding winged helix-turn-helix (wHTH) protein
MSALENPVYRFGSFELEPAERRLSEAGKSIALTPGVFDTLVLLVERAGHLVSKDELMKVLWPRGYVDDSNLTKHIWFIRRALGDGEHDSRFIETVPKLGYRFVAPVTRASATLCPPPPLAAAAEGAIQLKAPLPSTDLPAGLAAQEPGAVASPATAAPVNRTAGARRRPHASEQERRGTYGSPCFDRRLSGDTQSARRGGRAHETGPGSGVPQQQ